MSCIGRYHLIFLVGICAIYETKAADKLDTDATKAEHGDVPGSEEPDEPQLFDFYDIVTLKKGSSVIFGTGIFRSTSGLVNYTNNVQLRPNSTLTLQAGDGINTGIVRNYGRMELYKNSKITGGGTIFEHGQFEDDEENNIRASKNKKECDDGYIIDDYDSQRDLTTDEEIQNAAYYDLVNNDDTPIHNFKIWFPGCGIFTASKELGDPSVKNTDFVRITNSMRGEGDQGKVDSSIRFGITNALNLAYDLKKPTKKYGIVEFMHVSDKTDDVKSSFFSIHGFDTYETDGATKFKFGYNLDKDVWVPKVNEDAVLGKTMPNTEKAATYEQNIMETLNTTPEDNQNLFAYKDWESNDPVTTYHGDHSRFNGVYKLKRGSIIMKNTAGIFGGRVELGDADGYTSSTGAKGTLALHSDLVAGEEEAQDFIKEVKPTEFEWESGAKDEYNRTNI